jgi:serine/threonine protein kinase HipA of HipAB toxin-antitoxin module
LAGARCFDFGERRYLEVPRFDRTPEGGRRGVVSLSALCPEADAFGLGVAWPRSAADLFQRGFIDEDTHRKIASLHGFGELIGNTDRHGGNLSFWLDDHLPFRLAPAYDMLPMFWAPGPQGETHVRGFQPAPPMPGDEVLREEVRPWAREFWERVGDSEIISDAFRRMAKVVG